MSDSLTIDVLAPGEGHWFAPHATRLVHALQERATVRRWTRHEQVPEGDIAFLLSYPRIVPAATLTRHRSNVVAHASDLPKGRGMSPMPWQILEGTRSIPVTLFEAVPELDAGPIYAKSSIHTEGNELLPELRALLGHEIIQMCLEFVRSYPEILQRAIPQEGEPSFYRMRTPADSELDPSRPLAEQFDLLRVVDNQAYPAFFRYRGRTYRLAIEAAEDEP